MDELLQERLAAAIAASRADDTPTAFAQFAALAEQYPDNALVHYERACAYDRAGEEAFAAPSYQRALDLGLGEEHLPSLYVGYGSTLRNLGHLAESRRILEEAIARFPAYDALRAFLALTLYSLGDAAAATRLLLRMSLQPSIEYDGYQGAIDYYLSEIELEGAAEKL